MSSDQGKENNSSEERIEKIKQEETEDPTEYYAQGDSTEHFDEQSEFSKPVPHVEKAMEEMSLLKAVAYLGFGLAALAIVFILFFIRDLDHRVGGVDSALISLEEKMAPLRKEVRDGLDQVNSDIKGLTTKLEDRENRAAVMELKRSLIAIQSMKLSDSPKAEAKSNEVIASIQALLGEFGSGDSVDDKEPSPATSIGEVKVEEVSDLIELPTVEQSSEDNTGPQIEEAESEENTAPPTEESESEENTAPPTEESEREENVVPPTEELEESIEENTGAEIDEEGDDEDDEGDEDDEDE
jgi:hypothetical protein